MIRNTALAARGVERGNRLSWRSRACRSAAVAALSLSAGLGAASTAGGAVETPVATPQAQSAPLAQRTRLESQISGLRVLGAPLHLRGRVDPPNAGRIVLSGVGTRRELSVAADGSFTARFTSQRRGRLCPEVTLEPAVGFERASRSLCTEIRAPVRGLGSRGKIVRYLEDRLARRHYTLLRRDEAYREDTRDAVLAFQKIHGLVRDGMTGPQVWRALLTAHTPRSRFRGTHIEVDKGRQVLFEVRDGRVRHVAHVSTGATGNTPEGMWRVYRKEPGFNSIGMYYSLYFLRGFAVHGYESVPTHPASHGCVRVPLWYAPRLYARWGRGDRVRIHSRSLAAAEAAGRASASGAATQTGGCRP